MRLLHELFPGLEECKIEWVPDWSYFDYPWEILGKVENGVLEQISKLLDGREVLIHESAKIGDCVSFEGPTIVGPNAEIRHGAYIRGGSWICEGALVGHSSEIKNSILLPGAKAPHFNYVGDSILGINSNIGAGVKLSNVRNDRRTVALTLKDGTRIDSGSHKLGALVGDGTQIGCNVVTNPGTLIPPNSMIGPNNTISGWLVTKSE